MPSTEPTPTRTRRRTCTLLALTLLLALNTFALLHNLPTALAGDTDFRALYAAGAILRDHQATRLYDYDLERTAQNTLVSPHPGALPFLYPPYAALPFVPLSALPYRAAFLTFLTLNLALLIYAANLLASTLELPSAGAENVVILPRSGRTCFSDHLSRPILIFICLAFLPVSIAFYQGQVSLILLLCFTAACVALQKNKPFHSGLYLSLALIKFHVVLPVILLYAIWRNGPLLRGFLTGATALTVVCLLIQGPHGLYLYAQTLLGATNTGAIGAENPYTVFSANMPNLHGLAVLLLGPGHWTTLLVLLASLAVLACTAAQPPSLPRALTAALLVSYHLHMHDLTLLLIPTLVTFNQLTPRANRLQTATAILWMTSPLLLYVIATGTNGLLAPLMLPFLSARNAGCPTHRAAMCGDHSHAPRKSFSEEMR